MDHSDQRRRGDLLVRFRAESGIPVLDNTLRQTLYSFLFFFGRAARRTKPEEALGPMQRVALLSFSLLHFVFYVAVVEHHSQRLAGGAAWMPHPDGTLMKTLG